MSTTDRTKGVYRRIWSADLMDKRINRLSIGAELALKHLTLLADDYGNLLADPDILHHQAFPRRPAIDRETMEGYMAELVDQGLVEFYEADEDRHLHILHWQTLQPAGKNGKRVRRVTMPDRDDEHPEHGPVGDTEAIPDDPGESEIIPDDPDSTSATHTHTHSHTQAHSHTHPHPQAETQPDGAGGDDSSRAKGSGGLGGGKCSSGEAAEQVEPKQNGHPTGDIDDALRGAGITSASVIDAVKRRGDLDATLVERCSVAIRKDPQAKDPAALLSHRLQEWPFDQLESLAASTRPRLTFEQVLADAQQAREHAQAEAERKREQIQQDRADIAREIEKADRVIGQADEKDIVAARDAHLATCTAGVRKSLAEQATQDWPPNARRMLAHKLVRQQQEAEA